MKVLHTVNEVDITLKNHLANGKKIGFVPTMGALHMGHSSLIEKALSENDVVICSIFVNPTQFNDKKDLEKYPRTLSEDEKILTKTGCHFLFAPSVEEMYPNGKMEEEKWETGIDLGSLDKVMEGKHRPGHFNGVVQVVNRLFDIVKPTNAYFGQKDFQQLAIIKRMVQQLKLPVRIIGCPIVREHDGLAMSSRNRLLSTTERLEAPLIYKTLLKAKEMLTSSSSIYDIIHFIETEIAKSKLMQLEYFEVADSETLISIENASSKNIIACIAVRLGNIRLIDNIILNP